MMGGSVVRNNLKSIRAVYQGFRVRGHPPLPHPLLVFAQTRPQASWLHLGGGGGGGGEGKEWWEGEGERGQVGEQEMKCRME